MRASKNELRDALGLAHSMLVIVQKGGSLTTAAWFDRMHKIEAIIKKDGECTCDEGGSAGCPIHDEAVDESWDSRPEYKNR